MGLAAVNPKVWLFLLALFFVVFGWRIARMWLRRKLRAWRATRARRRAAHGHDADGNDDGDTGRPR